MKTFSIIIASLIIGIPSLAQNEMELKDGITVYGQAIVTAPADFVNIQFIIENKDEKFTDSYNKLKSKVENISSELIKLGLNEYDISTSTFFTRTFDKLSFFDPDLKEYRISVKTTVKLRKLDLFESLMLTLIKNDVTQIENIDFGVNSPDSLGYLGLDLAIKQAIEKKNILSKNLGISTSGVFSVEEILEANIFPNYSNSGPNPFNPVGSIPQLKSLREIKSFYVQSIEIIKKVKVVFKLSN